MHGSTEMLGSLRMGAGLDDEVPSFSRCRPGLGTFVKVRLSGGSDDAVLLAESERAFREVFRLESLLNFHDPTSELSALNRQACFEPVPVSPEMVEVLSFALTLSEATDGLYDVTVAGAAAVAGRVSDLGPKPDPRATFRDVELEKGAVFFKRPLLIDLAGIAKGFVVDRAFSRLTRCARVLVDAGGDMRMSPWRGERLAIRLPFDDGFPFLEVEMKAPSVATSSYYRQKQTYPVFDPRTGRPLCDPRCVSVFAESCMRADALTKAVFLVEDADDLLGRFEARALVVDEKGVETWLGDV